MTRLPRYRTGDGNLDAALTRLIEDAGIAHDEDLVFEMLVSIIRMGRESGDRGDLKLANAALKELRYSFLVFEPYRDIPKVSIFGSARTAPDDPAYTVARDLGAAMAEQDWMVITGAGPGIMEAGIEGAGSERAFGVNIRLPFEQEATSLLAGDPKLINYRYFFTRKITFMKESKAFALLPGGFGTMDEAFELLTLMQTGRSPVCPIVLIEPERGTYWEAWERFVTSELIERRGLIRPEDLSLVRRCASVAEAVDEICRFYTRFHSMRFVGSRLVIRLRTPIDDAELTALNSAFGDIIVTGRIERVEASSSEIEADDLPDLPRIAMRFDRIHFARLRSLIDALNG